MAFCLSLCLYFQLVVLLLDMTRIAGDERALSPCFEKNIYIQTELDTSLLLLYGIAFGSRVHARHAANSNVTIPLFLYLLGFLVIEMMAAILSILMSSFVLFALKEMSFSSKYLSL